MNSYILQIIGTAELPEALEIGKNYLVSINADCNSVTKVSNEDGNFTYKHKLKQLTCEILKDNGEIIKAKDNKSQSQKLRNHLMIIAKERGLDEQEFYDKTITQIRHRLMEILDLLESYENKS